MDRDNQLNKAILQMFFVSLSQFFCTDEKVQTTDTHKYTFRVM